MRLVVVFLLGYQLASCSVFYKEQSVFNVADCLPSFAFDSCF